MTAVPPGDSERISVSREALRADLMELELRLTDKLRLKADSEAVRSLSRDLADLSKVLDKLTAKVGEIDQFGSPATRKLEARVKELETTNLTKAGIKEAIREAVGENRGRVSHRITLIGVAITVMGFVIYVALTARTVFG